MMKWIRWPFRIAVCTCSTEIDHAVRVLRKSCRGTYSGLLRSKLRRVDIMVDLSGTRTYKVTIPDSIGGQFMGEYLYENYHDLIDQEDTELIDDQLSEDVSEAFV